MVSSCSFLFIVPIDFLTKPWQKANVHYIATAHNSVIFTMTITTSPYLDKLSLGGQHLHVPEIKADSSLVFFVLYKVSATCRLMFQKYFYSDIQCISQQHIIL